jgi:lipopolysaccharide transport system ATP-binding protein
MTYAIKVENLGKKYTIKHENQTRYSTLRDQLSGSARSMVHRLRHPFQAVQNNRETEQFWALKDINFEIQPGDRVGIIGRNGAGKSTLLKILSRITAPTTGKVTINGRVASLLEVGTGFHPELSGRENIFLNGAVLGMRKTQIQKKFDEIVDFAEVEKFLDTPVKHYSSGMYVRLAFAVAAHLEPEILIVDEVLAVGDAQFQKKCLGKMGEVGTKGRTVLYVSHNMGTISQLCNRSIFLQSGLLNKIGATDDCIQQYLHNITENKAAATNHRKPTSDQKVIINSIQIMDSKGIIDNSNLTVLEIRYDTLIVGTSYSISFELTSISSGVIFTSSTLDLRPNIELGNHDKIGEYRAISYLPTQWLLSGTYSIRVAATIPAVEILDIFPEEITFTIHDSISPVAILGEGRRGVIAPRLDWKIEKPSA